MLFRFLPIQVILTISTKYIVKKKLQNPRVQQSHVTSMTLKQEEKLLKIVFSIVFGYTITTRKKSYLIFCKIKLNFIKKKIELKVYFVTWTFN